MAYCPGQIWVQIGTEKFSEVEGLSFTKSRTAGSSSCSFTLTFDGVPTLPGRKAYFSVHDNLDRKLFAGCCLGFSKSVSGNTRIYNFSKNQDFSYFATKGYTIKKYNGVASAHFTDHMAALVSLGGQYSADRNFNAIDSPPLGDGPTGPFSCAEVKLIDALKQLCDQFEYDFNFNFGAWENLDELYLLSTTAGAVCSIDYWPKGSTTGTAPFNIHLPPGVSCEQYQNPRYEIDWSAAANRATVLGKGGNLELGLIGPKEKTIRKDIPPNSVDIYYDLEGNIIEILSTEIRYVVRILAFTPVDGGPVGTSVSIEGAYFTGTDQIFFGEVEQTTFTVVDDEHITCDVPTGAVTGRIKVVTLHDGYALSELPFTVTS